MKLYQAAHQGEPDAKPSQGPIETPLALHEEVEDPWQQVVSNALGLQNTVQ